MFQPIAIVGQGCVLPGGCSPEVFGKKILDGVDLITQGESERWGVSDENIMGTSNQKQPDRTWSKRGGYVHHFKARFTASGLASRAPELIHLDPLFRWVAYASDQALSGVSEALLERTGVILGNLSYPTHHMSRYAEQSWFGSLLSTDKPPAEDRFMSGYPILKLREIFGLKGPAFALDAACASALYAIKYACDALHDGRADVMLAGAVNRADDLFIHVGFCALNAMSPTGQSRPFHRDANGLVPAEGCAVVALKRLEDAQAAGDKILGIVRGVGLSNDGSDKGLLAPSTLGQQRAIRSAYAGSGIDPCEVGYLECHATGTPVGDATELRSLASVFSSPTPIGSLKSNLGHLITAAGGAALLKVLYQFEHQALAPSLHVENLNPVLNETPFDVVSEARPWTEKRIAGISAFGFGGNNAHLIVTGPEVPVVTKKPSTAQRTVSVVGLDMMAGEAVGLESFTRVVEAPSKLEQRTIDSVSIELSQLRFPPNDLKVALGQQLGILRCCWGALSAVGPFHNPNRVGVFIGMGADPDVCRYGARWRASDLNLPKEKLRLLQDGCHSSLTAAGVLGAMPNIPANRVNAQWDFGGASTTVSAEEGSGLVALQLARRAIACGELDAAVVGAVDFSCNQVHSQAASTRLSQSDPLDAAVVWILRAADCMTSEDTNIAKVITPDSTVSGSHWPESLGHSHAASGLLNLSVALIKANSNQKTGTEITAMGGHRFGATIHRGASPLPITARPIRPITFKTNHPPPVPPSSEGANVEVIPRPPKLMSLHGLNALRRTSQQVPKIQHAAPSDSGNSVAAVVQTQIDALYFQHYNYLQTQHQLHEQYLAHQKAMNRLLLSVRVESNPVTVGGNTNVVQPLQKQQSQSKVVEPEIKLNKEIKPIKQDQDAPNPYPPALEHEVTDFAPEPTGMTLDTAGLKIHASGLISEIFGSLFEPQDKHAIQTRMPEPPLLLAQRMTGLSAQPGSMKTGTIWTETDVRQDAWWLHVGRMPAGIMIESGQADLMLISYLGIDLLGSGDRAYRLLGCELMYHDDLPKVGETLCYDIHVDGHANQGPIRIFFFHYDCRIDGRPHLTVRQGQAGFFTKEELANSAGILWQAEDQEIDVNAVLDQPLGTVAKNYSLRQIEAFSNGHPWDCFGEVCFRTRTHTRTPRIQNGKMLFLKGPLELDPEGGPWKRGYLRCEVDILPEDWFFEGHFKNDPCMPGTLMFEGCLQAMAFVLTAYGFTNLRDGWRFQPMRKRPYPLRCRGQVTPRSKKLIYEIFIESVCAGPEPYLIADLLCTVDGLKAFHARAMGLELVPDFPITTMPELLLSNTNTDEEECATDSAGFPFNWQAMIKSALGKPSEAFGLMYTPFDRARRVARLPGPPYHFMSRVIDIKGNLGTCEIGTKITLAYDIPPDAWYFEQSAYPTMPFCVLLEAALQPCGWLASAAGSALTVDADLSFRNLDGTGRLIAELGPNSGTLYTEVEITNISRSAGMIIESFELRCYTKDHDIYELKTVFGFFPDAALRNQVGLPTTDSDRRKLSQEPIVPVVLKDGDEYTSGNAALPKRMLRMIDQVTAWSVDGGEHGLGFARAEKIVDPNEWFFKAHFFQDPVQPGSLGIEAMIQLTQWVMIEKGLCRDMKEPRFECLATGVPMQWQYRGQVLPENKTITTTLDVVSEQIEETDKTVVVDASLWIDGKRIYQAKGLAMRLIGRSN